MKLIEVVLVLALALVLIGPLSGLLLNQRAELASARRELEGYAVALEWLAGEETRLCLTRFRDGAAVPDCPGLYKITYQNGSLELSRLVVDRTLSARLPIARR